MNTNYKSWLIENIREIKESIAVIRNETIPRIHDRIDNMSQRMSDISERIAYIEGKIKSNPQKLLYIIILLLILGVFALAGVKTLPSFADFLKQLF